jgi:hypothetical protein
LAATDARITLAEMAVDESGMGVIEDKVTKNHFALEYIYSKYMTRPVGLSWKMKSTKFLSLQNPSD